MPNWIIALVIIVDIFQVIVLMWLVSEISALRATTRARKVDYPQHRLYAIMNATEAYIYDLDNCTYVAKVWIDYTHAWNIEYADEKRYIPINSILMDIGYLVL